MSESFSFNGQLLEIAEFKTYQMATFLISVLDEWDLNGRFISKEEGEKGCKSIIGFPLVAKLIVNGDGVPTDFGGHEVYKVQNADGSSEYKYGTQPIGSIMDAWIEQRNVPGYDGVRDCIMISAKIWSVRCPEYCAVLNKRYRKGCVSSSWELISDSVEIVSQGKLLKDISFIGNCLLGSNVPGAVPGAGMLQCAEKDDTDTVLAANIAIERGYNELRFFCAVGGRISHTLANIQMLLLLKKRNIDCVLFGENCEIMVLENESVKIPKLRGYLSVFSLGETAVVSEKGVKYSLDKHTLSNDYPLGVSNEISGDFAEITVHSGAAVVVLEDE